LIFFGGKGGDLSGTWRFALDRNDVGVAQGWPARTLADTIRLPGILNAQGYGDPITASTPWVLSLYDRQWHQREDYKAYTKDGKVKVPFLSQPQRHYLGAAWYAREVEVPKAWAGKRVTLFMERPRWGSTVWVDGRELGANRSLVAEHVVDLGMLAPGRHRIAVRVDSRMQLNYRLDSHSVSDSLGMSWNGIVGKIELRATSPVYIDDAQVYPDVATRSARVVVRLGNAGGRAGSGTVTGQRQGASRSAGARRAAGRVHACSIRRTPRPGTNSRRRCKRCISEAEGRRARRMRAGSRSASCRSRPGQRHAGQRPARLHARHPPWRRLPLTGYPPTDVAYWKKIFKVNKAWGINHVRFHSFNPPEAAFQAADEVGIYLQPEPGMWNNVSPGSPMEAMLYEETERMIRAYGNHPSFLLLSPSNEPSGRWKESFDKWIAHYRALDPRRLYTNGTGHTEPSVPKVDEGTDYLAIQRIGPKPLRNKTGWFGRDYAASMEGVKVPVLAHETGQWVAYPDFSIIDKFTGYLRPGNYEIFRDSARAHGVLDKNRAFALASGQMAAGRLQGRDRGGAAHARHERLPAARPARLPRPGHGPGRRARHLLGAEGLCHGRAVPPLQRRDGAAGAPDALRADRERAPRRCRSRSRTMARRRWRRRSPGGASRTRAARPCSKGASTA
jgi:beta-galactosidase